MMQVIVTVEGEYETVHNLSNGAILNFQWPCVTPNPDFKVTTLFNAK